MIALVLMIVAIVLFVLAFFNIGPPYNLTAAGLACMAGSLLVGLLH